MPSIKLPLEDKFSKNIIVVWEQMRDQFKKHHYIKLKEHSNGKYLFGIDTGNFTNADMVESNYYNYPNNKTLFSFSKELNELIPENTYLKKIELYIYVKKNSENLLSPAEIALSFQKGEPEDTNNSGKSYNEKYTKHYFKDGWNKFEFTSDFLDISAKFRSLNLAIFEWSIFSSNLQFTDKDLGLTTIENAENFLVPYDSYDDSNPPYAIVEYGFNKPKSADSLTPENKTVNPRTSIRFTWNTKIAQTAYELSYSVNGGNYKTITKTTVDRFYNMPADTIKDFSGSVNWKVRVKDESDTWSDYQEASFTLGVPEQIAPRLIYPTGSYIKNTEPLEFSWVFVTDTIEEQKSYELQYRINNGDWKSISEETSRTNYTLNDIRSFGTSTGQWRVRVINNYGEESQWSEIGKFQVYGVPPRPQIVSVSNKNLPTIKWYSDQQEMFKIRVIDKDNNCIYDSDYILDYANKEFKIPKVINNGKYTFTLTIKNKYGIDSEKAELTQKIEVINKKEVDFNIFKSNYFLEIVSKEPNFSVIRDGKSIGKTEDGSFKDYTGANGKYYNYQIMVESDDEISLSKVIKAKVDFIGCTLAIVNNPSDFIVLRYNIDNLPGRSLELSINANEIEIEGAKYPFIEYGDTVLDQKSYDFFIKDKVKLTNMIEQKEEFLLRDYYGDNICGLIKNIGLNKNRFGYELNFTILRTSDKYE
ncbi:MAG: hypothetical protein MR285_07525 [Peptoniphilus sp.]|uniref:hypothetical protein n=1 Tax=Peptoniphilus sp. TaxID=1971214 RepID=UPI0025DE3F00|nr:hypothetical protein [Peptoniphilus sp.]MCI5643943.1 hypothetical protein [Peptoniphilus sp.]